MSSSSQAKSSSTIRSNKVGEESSSSSSNLVANNVVAGLVSGITGTIIGYPLDLIKTRLQVKSSSSAVATKKKGGGFFQNFGYYFKNNNVFQTTASIWRTEGPRGFFKGVMTPLVSLTLLSSVVFPTYTSIRLQLNAKKGWDMKNAIAGMTCAPFCCCLTVTEGLVRTQMQVDNIQKKQFQGSWHCLSTLVRMHGPKILFTGTSVVIVRDAAFLSSYFFVYEGMKATLTGKSLFDEKKNNNNYYSKDAMTTTAIIRPELAIPIAGGISGGMAWLSSIPFDCIRAGIHSQKLELLSSPTRRKTALQVFRELVGTEQGIRALYRGTIPAVTRAFIVSASRFSAYEITLWALSKEKTEKQIMSNL